MEPIEYIGFLAAGLSCVSLIPEVLQALKTRKLRDVAWGMLLLMGTSSLLWGYYGLVNHVMPLVLSSSIHLCLQAMLLILKFKFEKAKKLELQIQTQTDSLLEEQK